MLTWLLLAAIVIAGASWAASPAVAFHGFREAARAADRDGLNAVVDYAALRANLEPQLRPVAPPQENGIAAAGRRVLERFGRAAAPLGLADPVEDRLTPVALAQQADGRITAFRYVTPSRVHVEVAGGSLFVLERIRPFSWTVVHMRLPPG